MFEHSKCTVEPRRHVDRHVMLINNLSLITLSSYLRGFIITGCLFLSGRSFLPYLVYNDVVNSRLLCLYFEHDEY